LDRVGRQANHIWIPVRGTRVTACHALTDLHQGMLDVTRLLFILQVLGELLVRKLTPEPGVPPEQKWHENDQPARGEKKQSVASGHTRLGRGSDGFWVWRRSFLSRVWKC